jgi:hypothetical protein
MNPSKAASGVQPFPSGAASNSAVIRLPPALPNIVTVTQFWLARGSPKTVGRLVLVPFA